LAGLVGKEQQDPDRQSDMWFTSLYLDFAWHGTETEWVRSGKRSVSL